MALKKPPYQNSFLCVALIAAVIVLTFSLPFATKRCTPELTPNVAPQYHNATDGQTQDCVKIDVIPGNKVVFFTVHIDLPSKGDMRLSYTTRPMQIDEVAAKEILIGVPRLDAPIRECAYIIREHALPAPVVSK